MQQRLREHFTVRASSKKLLIEDMQQRLKEHFTVRTSAKNINFYIFFVKIKVTLHYYS
jgi:hypothetical protein